MKRLIYTILALMISCIGFAQIEEEINNFEDVAATRVANGRRLLVKSLENNDWAKVTEIYAYLNQAAEKEGYDAFTFYEHLYITMLTSQWEQWTVLAKNAKKSMNKMLFPDIKHIHNELYYKLKDESDRVREQVINAQLSSEDKDIMLVFIHLNKVENPDPEYNKMIRNFKLTYAKSEYTFFVKTVMPAPKILTSAVYGFGATLIAPTSNLETLFLSGSAFNLNVALFFNKFYLAGDMSVGSLELREDSDLVHEDGTKIPFDKGEKATISLFNLRAGFSIINEDRFVMTPYINVGTTRLESPKFDKIDEENATVEIFSVLNIGFGFRHQILLHRREYTTYYGVGMNWTVSMVVDAGYLVNSRIETKNANGNIAYGNVGLLFGFGSH